jgi:hypothetical protein
MWFWDFTPASNSYKKPITKKQLQKLRENYAEADKISKKARELEEKEKESVKIEMDDMLDDIL